MLLATPSESPDSLCGDDLDVLNSARALAEAKEFLRAAFVLRSCKSMRASFMRVYFTFLVSVIPFLASLLPTNIAS